MTATADRPGARRRRPPPPTPVGIFERILYRPVDWPGKTTRLDRDSVDALVGRPTSGQPSPAEVYHENSKLFPHMIDSLLAANTDAEQVRKAFVLRRAAALPGGPADPTDRLIEPVTSVLAAACGSGPPTVFYAVDIRVLAGDVLVAYEPLTGRVDRIRSVAPSESDALPSALDLACNSGGPTGAGTLVFLVGSMARDAVLFGERGYRHTLSAAGRVAERLSTAARSLQVSCREWWDFVDRQVDSFLEADGVEEATVAVMEIGGDVRDGSPG